MEIGSSTAQTRSLRRHQLPCLWRHAPGVQQRLGVAAGLGQALEHQVAGVLLVHLGRKSYFCRGLHLGFDDVYRALRELRKDGGTLRPSLECTRPENVKYVNIQCPRTGRCIGTTAR